MNAKTQLGLIITVAFLLLNPIGMCASISIASSPAHPCCPKAPAPPADCRMMGCFCATTAPTAITTNTEQERVLALPASAPLDAVYVVAVEPQTLELFLFAPHDRYLSVHQLLL